MFGKNSKANKQTFSGIKMNWRHDQLVRDPRVIEHLVRQVNCLGTLVSSGKVTCREVSLAHF